MEGERGDTPGRLIFWLLIVFLVLEFARPQPFVRLRLQFLISLLLPLIWLFAKQRPWSPILTAQVAFLVLNTLTVPTVLNNFAAYMTSRAIFGNVAIAIAISWLFSWRQNFRIGSWVWMTIMAYCAVFALTHGGRGPGGFLGDENDIALGLSTVVPFAFFGFEQFRGRERWISAGLLGLYVVAVVASFSRGGFLGLVSALGYCFFKSRNKLKMIAVGLVVAAASAPFIPQEYVDELNTIGTESNTAQGRFFLWDTAWNMWKANPILGVGGGNFNFHAGDFQPTDAGYPPGFYARSWSGTTTHSLYYQILAEQGLMGMAILGFIVWEHFRSLRTLRRRVERDEEVTPDLRRDVVLYSGALTSAVIGLLAAGAFLSAAYYPYLFYLTGMGVGLVAMVERELSAPSDSHAGDPDLEDPPSHPASQV